MAEQYTEGEALTFVSADEVVSKVLFEEYEEGNGHAIVQEENSGYHYIVPAASLEIYVPPPEQSEE